MTWKPLSLRARILLLLGGLVLITIGGGIASIWYIYSMEHFFTSVFDSEIPAMRAALGLKNELVAQRGYVTYYVQDADPQWLEQLTQHQRHFEASLKGARQFADTERAREILREIDAQYVRYDVARDEVIKLYKAGNQEEGLRLHKQSRERMFDLMSLVRQFEAIHEETASRVREENRRWAKTVKESAVVALVAAMVVGLILAYTLIRQVLGPIRELAVGTQGFPSGGTHAQRNCGARHAGVRSHA
jgi:CHASE3 domain sensor protein